MRPSRRSRETSASRVGADARDERQAVRAVDGRDRVELHGLEPPDLGRRHRRRPRGEIARVALVRDDVAPERGETHPSGTLSGACEAIRPEVVLAAPSSSAGSSRSIALFVAPPRRQAGPRRRRRRPPGLEEAAARGLLKLVRRGLRAAARRLARLDSTQLDASLCAPHQTVVPARVVCFDADPVSTRGEAQFIAPPGPRARTCAGSTSSRRSSTSSGPG